jgi:hypothetical protein
MRGASIRMTLPVYVIGLPEIKESFETVITTSGVEQMRLSVQVCEKRREEKRREEKRLFS